MSVFGGVLNNLPGFQDRFWYWNGKSGKRYIHSIYSPDGCPPLPGAIYVTVRKLASGQRVPVAVGRFCEEWDYLEALGEDHRLGFSRIDEIHVHLLANDDDSAVAVVKDLEAGIGPRPVVTGFQEDAKANSGWQASLFEDYIPERLLASA
jgi:hypothetical protein